MRRSFTESRMRSPFRTKPERAAGGGVGGDVQHDGAERGAAHARVGDAHHVLDAALRELFRNRQIAGFRHAFRRVRAGVLQHHNVLRLNIERWVVDPGGEIGE